GSCLSYGHSCWGAHGKRAGPPRQLGRMGLSERWALVKFVPDKSNDNTQRHAAADSQINDDGASIFDNPTFAFNTDDENQQHDESKQADGQVVIKPSSLRRTYSTDPEDEFSANDINMVGDDLLDSRNMRYYKIRNPTIKKILS
ncbi:hypothetical protein Bhyg_12466, partial [Pseudolycoriella hygida]